jgi:deoxycytidylate deaminase
MILSADIKIPKYFRWAKNAATHSDHNVHKMGAVIIDAGRCVTHGHNKNRTHPRSKSEFSIHAELDALLGERWESDVSFFRMDMYVVRITKGGKLATSKPCEDCMVLIKEAGLKSVTYINEEGEIIVERL